MKPKHAFKARLRIMSGDVIALGPGKVELLTLIAETGSLRQAAARMDMSYMRAWSLVRMMNASFRVPMVEASRGGKDGGGASLTTEGREILALYCQMQDDAQRAARKSWARLRAHLK